jgi:hypothetical protein
MTGAITRAVLCPSPPLLAAELCGRAEVLPGLRDACATAVARLLAAKPDIVVVVGTGAATATWDPDRRLDLVAYAPALGLPEVRRQPGLPLALGLGTALLNDAGYDGPRVLQSVGEAAPPEECLRLGAALSGAALDGTVALLVMGDGSARRTEKAPGHFDERAEPFDASVERAVRDGDMAAIAGLSPDLARELMATGRAAWQVLAGALGAASPAGAVAGEILYAAAPFGVSYLVAVLDA